MIYADYNATGPLCPAAIEAIEQAISKWGNPSSAHNMGREAEALLQQCREAVAEATQVRPKDVVFTSGGSEANNLAVMGSFLEQGPGFRLLTTPIEHSSITDLVPLLLKWGAQVEHVPILASGSIDLKALEQQIETFKPNLVSIMSANNETGVVFSTAEISRICQEKHVTFHTDAVQAFGKLPAEDWNKADLISISAHKIGGPKGVGALLIRGKQKLSPTVYGGSQEIKRRGGTQNVLGIAGFGGACRSLSFTSHFHKERDRFESTLKKALTDITVQGEQSPRLANTSNIRFPGIRSEILLSALDIDGVCVSVGSACSSGSVSPSHVLLAMGLSEDEARQAVRFSWSSSTPAETIDTVANLVISHVRRIRERRSNA